MQSKARKQNWSAGAIVKVGFLAFTVIAKIPTPGDFKPDAYVLSRGTTFYSFVPHNGLTKITTDEARAMLADAKRIAAKEAAAAIEKAAAQASHDLAVEVLVAEGAEADGLLAEYFGAAGAAA